MKSGLEKNSFFALFQLENQGIVIYLYLLY